MRTLIVSLILLLTPALVFARDEGVRTGPKRIGPMDVIKYNTTGYQTVGYIVAEDEDSVTIIPEKGGRLKVRREVIEEIAYAAEEPKWISSDEMVEGFTSQLLKLVEEKTTFRVAKVTDQTVYLNASQGAVDKRGWKANIYREGEEIIDPITGDVLGHAKQLVGAIQIIGEADTYSEALPVDTPISAFQEGDVGVFLRKKPTLAVANITTVDGKKSPYGAMISEAIVGKLSNSRDLILLERKQIGQVLEELAKQDAMHNRFAPDVETPADTVAVPGDILSNMSNLNGADALLVGTVAAKREGDTWTRGGINGATVSLRILHTQTGAVLYSTHYLVALPERPGWDGWHGNYNRHRGYRHRGYRR